MSAQGKHPILIVEDNPEDYEAIEQAFREGKLANPLYLCRDGEEALDYLFRRGKYANAKDSPRPCLILLDLKLPRLRGDRVLSEIKQDPNLKTIPVVVLTSSADDQDVETCYSAGANSYVRKPVEVTSFVQAIQRLQDY